LGAPFPPILLSAACDFSVEAEKVQAVLDPLVEEPDVALAACATTAVIDAQRYKADFGNTIWP
jgi:hypothetical protein